MEKFRIIRPSRHLTPYVRHYWLLETDATVDSQRIIPTGNIELILHRGCPLKRNDRPVPLTSLCGQTTSFTELIPTGIVRMIAVVFQPFGAQAFFTTPLSECKDSYIPAEAAGPPELNELEDAILNAPDDETCIRLIETFLTRRLTPFPMYMYERIRTAVEIINSSDGELSVTRLAEKVCLTSKQFQRIFNRYVGINPKEFMRIVRFHKALFTLQNHPSIPFTHLAYQCGYYDQAHLINEFKLFSGYTPGEYVAVCPPYSDYFSL